MTIYRPISLARLRTLSAVRTLTDGSRKQTESFERLDGIFSRTKVQDSNIFVRLNTSGHPNSFKSQHVHKTRILTVPNFLTLSRIATSPVIGYFIWNGMHSQALACFAFAATTDLLDGFIARRFNQDSDLGVVLDPIADKLLLTTCFVALNHTNLMPFWLVKGFITRDILILAGGSIVRYFGFPESPTLKKFFDFKNYPTLGFEPTLVSKCNTALQCLLIFLHLSTNHLVGIPSYDWTILSLHGVTAFTSTFSLSQYILRIIKPPIKVRAPKSKS